MDTVQQYVPGLDSTAVTRRFSRTGKYVSITVVFTAESREQLDEIYFELSRNRRVLFLL